ncbi:MAG: polysaccharide deacetylase family protein [Oscillospiraceae bacterium]|nr:polysaccharide deacetylase family protein [Oscillospiraceae bacterium]
MKLRSSLASFLIAAAMAGQWALPVSAASSSVHGYGQGKITDSENRPIDAVGFTQSYGKYDCYALTPDSDNIILTFDQGYENGYTAKILDTLKQKNAKAIFFLTGDYVKAEPDLVRRMIDEGHMLGNHGMKHKSFPKLSDSEYNEEVMSLHQYMIDNYDYEMQYLRPPCGEFSEESLSRTKALGYKTIMWSFAHVDWLPDKQPECRASLDNMLKSAHPGAIYLLHSVSKTNTEVLGDLIDGLRQKGYKV